jgi:hypothetical protein
LQFRLWIPFRGRTFPDFLTNLGLAIPVDELMLAKQSLSS